MVLHYTNSPSKPQFPNSLPTNNALFVATPNILPPHNPSTDPAGLSREITPLLLEYKNYSPILYIVARSAWQLWATADATLRKADSLKSRPFTCVNCQGPQFCLSASRSLRRLIPKSKSRENAVYRCKAIVVNKPYRKNTLYQKVLASWGPCASVHHGGSNRMERQRGVNCV